MKFLRNLYGPTNPLLALMFNYLESNKESINCNFLQRVMPPCKSEDVVSNPKPNDCVTVESAQLDKFINQNAFNAVWRPWEILDHDA